MKDNTFVPQIGYTVELTDQYKDKWYMVSMERLQDRAPNMRDFRDFVREYVGVDSEDDYDTLTIRDLPKPLLTVAIPKDLLTLMDTIKAAHKDGFGFDLHTGNFMARKNGDIVITDPLVY
jgi:hypothetical protein